jgi:hypothetical protein
MTSSQSSSEAQQGSYSQPFISFLGKVDSSVKFFRMLFQFLHESHGVATRELLDWVLTQQQHQPRQRPNVHVFPGTDRVTVETKLPNHDRDMDNNHSTFPCATGCDIASQHTVSATLDSIVIEVILATPDPKRRYQNQSLFPRARISSTRQTAANSSTVVSHISKMSIQ